MKWYSHNDRTGCVAINTIPGYEQEDGHCWLIIQNPRTGVFNFQHGRGTYPGTARTCSLHESYYTDDGGYITVAVHDADGQRITKDFVEPYRGCTDTHTFIEFLESDIKAKGNNVYFYNPAFPTYESLDSLIADQIEKEIASYLANGQLNYVDWREIIYQMAIDFYQHNTEDNFSLTIAANNPQFYANGTTGYEQYYIDMQGFWRELYKPNLEAGDDEAYYTSGDRKHWNKYVFERPEMLNFWIDFLDTEGELQQFNVKNIGARTKSINDNNIKSIYFRETPDVLFVRDIKTEAVYDTSAYRYIQYADDSMFTISSQGQSAKNKLDELLYQHGYCTESASVTCIPIYYLEPNTRVYIHDDRTSVSGDYIITQISLPLTYNGTMQLTMTKAAETLI